MRVRLQAFCRGPAVAGGAGEQRGGPAARRAAPTLDSLGGTLETQPPAGRQSVPSVSDGAASGLPVTQAGLGFWCAVTPRERGSLQRHVASRTSQLADVAQRPVIPVRSVGSRLLRAAGGIEGRACRGHAPRQVTRRGGLPVSPGAGRSRRAPGRLRSRPTSAHQSHWEPCWSPDPHLAATTHRKTHERRQ